MAGTSYIWGLVLGVPLEHRALVRSGRSKQERLVAGPHSSDLDAFSLPSVHRVAGCFDAEAAQRRLKGFTQWSATELGKFPSPP